MRKGLFAGVALVAAMCSLALAASELLAIGPRAYMDEVAATGKPPQSADRSGAYRALTAAASIQPGDADMQFELGRMAWWAAHAVEPGGADEQHWLDVSVDHLQKVTSLRPTWGRAWTELANVQLQAGQLLEAKMSLMKGIRLAPYEGQSQWLALWTGFAVWNLMDWEEKSELLAIARHAMRYGRFVLVVKPAVKFGRETAIAPLFKQGSRGYKYLLYQLQQRSVEG